MSKQQIVKWAGTTLIGITLAGVLSVATPHGNGDDFIVHHEGEEYVAYLDAAGVATLCNGHTETAQLGQTATAEVCKQLRGKDLTKAFAAIERLVKVRLTNERGLALLSFVYNVGEGAFAKSTLLRLLNAGETAAACNQLPRWVNAGGKRLRGLVTRRNEERVLCLIGT